MQRRNSDNLKEFFSHFPEIKVVGALSCGNHDIATFRKKSLVEPEDFSNEPLQPVSSDRTTDLPAGCDPQSGAVQPVACDKDHEVCRAEFPSETIQIDEIFAAQYPVIL